MAATVAPFMPSSEQVASCQWMTESDLDFYEPLAKFIERGEF
jgi:hypothetical protein